ncbi:Ribose/Galactose isomerase-domain-containing protein [Blyttiomyces helicus]|uniref:Ribose/Galactose isomerase-domain-containing protein n=1 Tax=Blyttiomyces helicus TaxID=388810 RepID=A0A4P9WEB0_9FUNG|nr:Ribose/Galactose isomerase-domain-containing protein [Blyttiomyces helicus]|eukprot:RKO91051.1 Ribose/Galactose isomerase-domain-containing protein [Blyttiomyces helicus]
MSSQTQLIVIGSDHAGYEAKVHILECLRQDGDLATKWAVVDVGTHSGSSPVDYPDYAVQVSEKVVNGESAYEKRLGIVVCGSGIGISIAANKIKGVRCALCHDVNSATMSRRRDQLFPLPSSNAEAPDSISNLQHNDANILAIGGRSTAHDALHEIVKSFLSTDFDGNHHSARLDKIHQLEGCSYQGN